jgi:two-component system, OmpR family, KDP operon response regulator KdpE
LLEVLARNPGKLLGQRQLLREVWGPTYLDQTQYLRQYMAQLRRKLEDDPARPCRPGRPGSCLRQQPIK